MRRWSASQIQLCLSLTWKVAGYFGNTSKMSVDESKTAQRAIWTPCKKLPGLMIYWVSSVCGNTFLTVTLQTISMIKTEPTKPFHCEYLSLYTIPELIFSKNTNPLKLLTWLCHFYRLKLEETYFENCGRIKKEK